MNRSIFLAAMTAASAWASATYTFTSTNLGTFSNYTTCSTGPCANYNSSMQLTGSFTLAAALPANFSGASDITSQVTSYSFSDGLNTYSSSDPNSRIYQFFISTDGTGAISVASILIERWQSGSSPHSVGNRVALFNLNGASINQAENNLTCVSVGSGTSSGIADVCQLANNDAASSTSSASLGSWTGGGSPGGGGGSPTPTPTPAPAPVGTPTLGEWGMISLAVLLVGFAWTRVGRYEREVR